MIISNLKNLVLKNWILALMNKFFLIFLIIFNIQCNALSNPNINARTGILIDYHSNEILFELDSDAQIYPASMTKIMTSIVAFDLLEKNKSH